ncbi:MAG: MBL fold metallo-hydrolase [Alphaproteobacteria bacterium]|jgi:glyoxylase-like metal-dependent hydrolase (beta-lactamase superfamily II)|nr:MBL fold metallo-hydrolase [Alphaproteobacteria bacterium]
MSKHLVRFVQLFLCITLSMPVLAPAASAEDARSLTKVSGDVYRARSNHHYSLVVVTSAGVVVVDPINTTAASWLRENLGTITDKPITHLIYSHSHGDHASGGAALGAGTVIAQANAPATIDGVAPTKRFEESMNLTVGGKTFELTYLGKGHGADLIAVVVRPENVAFIVDVAAPKRMPYRDFPGSDIDAWIEQIRKVESLKFDIFAPGHGAVGVKADATAARVYMQKLRSQVLAGLKAGKSVDDLARDVTMKEYSDWQQYKAWGELNVRGMAS